MMRWVLLLILFSFMYPAFALGDAHDPKRIMPAQVLEKMQGGEDILFLDTRNSRDWTNAKRMIPDAVRVSDSQVLARIARETPKDKLIVTYCT